MRARLPSVLLPPPALAATAWAGGAGHTPAPPSLADRPTTMAWSPRGRL